MHDLNPRSFDAPRDDGHDARDHGYMLRGSESRTLTTVGAFRVVPAGNLRDGQERPLDPRRGDLYHLRQSGLGQATPAVGRDRAIVVLTERGRDLLEANRHPSANSERPCPAGARNRPRCAPGVLRRLPKAQGVDPRRAGLSSLPSSCGSTVRARRDITARRRRLRAQARVSAVPPRAPTPQLRQRRPPNRTPDDARLQRALQAFQPPRFPLLYRAWRQGGEAVLTVAASPAIRNALSPASGVAHAPVSVPSLSQGDPRGCSSLARALTRNPPRNLPFRALRITL